MVDHRRQLTFQILADWYSVLLPIMVPVDKYQTETLKLNAAIQYQRGFGIERLLANFLVRLPLHKEKPLWSKSLEDLPP